MDTYSYTYTYMGIDNLRSIKRQQDEHLFDNNYMQLKVYV